MSGIAGIYYLDGRPVERTDVERMVDSIAHRGPDDCGVWTDGSVGLGHRMLWTTHESLHEKLPLTNKSGDITITADARIDNRDELFSTLNFNGRPRETIADSEIILAAYEKWGEQCPEKLLGDFSFAIWDKRYHKIYCARDHMGVKPFYYYHSNKVFVFASEIKALLSLTEVPRRLNELMVAYYLISMFEDKEITFYKDILRLPPAHVMELDSEGRRLSQYWSLDPSRELKLSSDDEYAKTFRDIFKEAVHCRLRSAFPIGSMLSGGLDSSSIVCMARQLLSQNGGGRLHTFSLVFDNFPECDERQFINTILAQGSLEPHYIQADCISPLVDIDRIFYHQDEPFYAPNLFMDWRLCGTAQEHGVRVLLDGTDGDTTISHGIAYLTEMVRNWQWIELYREIKGLSKNFNRTPWRFTRAYCISPLLPTPIKKIWRMLRERCFHVGRVNHSVNPNFARHIGLSDHVQALQEVSSKPFCTEREHHYRQLTQGFIPFILEVSDRDTKAFALEIRFPFFDKRLVEFCLALPPKQKINKGWTRLIMRRSLANILPIEIQWRGGKSDLSSNFDQGLLTFENDLLKEVILNNPKNIENYVDIPTLRKIYHRYVSEKNSDNAMEVWKAVTIELWLRYTGLKA